MKRLIIAAAGLALVGGIIIGGMVANRWAPIGHAQQPTPTPPVTVTATPATPTVTPVPIGSGCYTNWNSATCATGWTAVATGEWTVIVAEAPSGPPTGAGVICAVPKVENDLGLHVQEHSDTDSGLAGSHAIQHEPCAICCGAVAGSPSVIGGVAEAPDLAAGAGGMGGGGYTLIGALGGVLAITVAGTMAAKRRGVQQ